MSERIKPTLALLIALLLAACGTLAGGSTSATATPANATPAAATPIASPSAVAALTPTAPARVASPALPAPPPTVPSRATLLSQIDTYERESARCGTTPGILCLHETLQALRSTDQELYAYAQWYIMVETCVSQSSDLLACQARIYAPTAAELRHPGTLDLYLINAPWCGFTSKCTTNSSATPRASTSPAPSATP
jgi:hypothetical protein